MKKFIALVSVSLTLAFIVTEMEGWKDRLRRHNATRRGVMIVTAPDRNVKEYEIRGRVTEVSEGIFRINDGVSGKVRYVLVSDTDSVNFRSK
jgi:hypothetical protein